MATVGKTTDRMPPRKLQQIEPYDPWKTTYFLQSSALGSPQFFSQQWIKLLFWAIYSQKRRSPHRQLRPGKETRAQWGRFGRWFRVRKRARILGQTVGKTTEGYVGPLGALLAAFWPSRYQIPTEAWTEEVEFWKVLGLCWNNLEARKRPA